MRPYLFAFLFLLSLSSSGQNISRSIGVISLNEKYDDNDWIELLNEDGTVWFRMNLYHYQNDPKWDQMIKNFDFFDFAPDYFLLKIKCVSRKGKKYKVLVNEHTGLTKYIKPASYLTLQTWEQYVLGAFSVSPNQNTNPVRIMPEGALVDPNEITEETLLQPVMTKGDWMQIRWSKDEIPNEESVFQFGWIRWKQHRSIIIEIFFFA